MNRSAKFLELMNLVNDDMATFETWFGYTEPTFSQRTLKVYDPDHYDIVPRQHHLENRLKKREQDLKNLQGIRKHYEEQEKIIEKDIDDIKSQINKKK